MPGLKTSISEQENLEVGNPVVTQEVLQAFADYVDNVGTVEEDHQGHRPKGLGRIPSPKAGALRSTVNRSMGFTPYWLMLGQEITHPAWLGSDF